MFSSKLKSYCYILKSAYLVLVLGLVALPYFQYADGHIHVIAGEVIIHWHYVPDNDKSNDNPKNSGHKHSAAELTIISSLNGLQGYLFELQNDLAPLVYNFSYPEAEEFQVKSEYGDSVSARSPPMNA